MSLHPCMAFDAESDRQWPTQDGSAPAPQHRPEIIIVAPAELLLGIEHRLPGGPVLAFSTLEELDRWRHAPKTDPPGIAGEVNRALSEADCRTARLPASLRSLLERVAAARRAPLLHELEEEWDSRRSFYRVWGAAISSTPSAFLRRVRSLHAQRLLGNGMTRKQAAMLAGYGSVDAMRRNLASSDPRAEQ